MSLIRRIIEEEYDKDGKMVKKTINEEYSQPLYTYPYTPTTTYPSWPQVTWTTSTTASDIKI
jgi:hypothetical protein